MKIALGVAAALVVCLAFATGLLPTQPLDVASAVVLGSMAVVVLCYFWLSRREGSFLNILTPGFIIHVPAYFLLPLAFLWFSKIHGAEYSTYAYAYVYGTIGFESLAFVFAYLRTGDRTIRMPFSFSYRNFTAASLVCLAIAVALYIPVLIEFRQYITNPREIYRLTHTGFGLETFLSSILGLISVSFILFARRHWFVKGAVIAAVTGLLWLHGSKGQVLNVALLLLLFWAYVKGRKIGLARALIGGLAMAAIVAGLFALTMRFGGDVASAIEAVSSYSDYTRNAMLVIDSRIPIQCGRLTWEMNVYGIIPRAIMPNKPKDFGEFYLAKKFYPDWFYSDTGSPDFGIGVQYADFGAFAIFYLLLFSLLQGWLARVFVNRLKIARHPADFVVMAFLTGVSILPVGGAGWLFPEIVVIAVVMRYCSQIGARPAAFAGAAGQPNLA